MPPVTATSGEVPHAAAGERADERHRMAGRDRAAQPHGRAVGDRRDGVVGGGEDGAAAGRVRVHCGDADTPPARCPGRHCHFRQYAVPRTAY